MIGTSHAKQGGEIIAEYIAGPPARKGQLALLDKGGSLLV
jgi:hypothetical protein